MAPAGQRLTAVVEVLVQELVQERILRSRVPSTVSITSLRDSKGRRRPVGHQHTGIPLELPRSVGATYSKSGEDLAAIATLSDISAVTVPNGGCQEPAPTAPTPKENKSALLSAGRGCGSATNEAASESKERCKNSVFQGKMGVSRNALRVRPDGRREVPRKYHTVKRGHGHSSPPKGSKMPNAGGILNKFQFNKDAIRRQHMSHENWIPDDLRIKMMRRSMAVIQENVYESVAQGSLVRKEKKRSSRSELEIVKTQEKFGTKHQRPCALCEQSFSEVNLVLAVPFKAIVDLRIAWHKTLPQAKGSTTKMNRTMLMPPQCYNEVKVCAFCSQLFHDPLGYRPTWDMEAASMRRKREQLAREKEREYWDPLRKATSTSEQEQQLLPAGVNQSGSTPDLLQEA
ncbi:unnamed protein product [Hapterophycus canaliculatus]